MIKKMNAIFLFALISGCESQTPDSKLVEQAHEVREVREQTEQASVAVQSASEELAQLRDAVATAERSVQAARSKLREQRLRLAEEKDALTELATDTAQFRLLQQRLLADPLLENAAVMSSVIDGRATIFGEVRRKEERRRAEVIASEIPGIERVDNLIVIDPESS